ncbi:MAG: type IV pilin protein [Thermodesulfobacteriota bacterium]
MSAHAAGGPAGSGGGTGGFTVLELLFTMAIVAILAVIALPVYSKFIQKARETAVISYLSKLVKAEELYYLGSPTASYTGDFDELETTGLITPSTGASTRIEHEYTFSLSSGTSGGKPVWQVTAAPVDGSTSARWFYADQSGILRFETGTTASAASPQVQN